MSDGGDGGGGGGGEAAAPPPVESAPVPEVTPAPEVTIAPEPTPEIKIEAAPPEAEPPKSAPEAALSSATTVITSDTSPDKTAVSSAANGTNIRSRLGQALEALKFRKRAKLDKVLALAAKKKSIKNDDVEKLLHVSDSTAQRYLNQLVLEGKLRRSGTTAGITYERA